MNRLNRPTDAFEFDWPRKRMTLKVLQLVVDENGHFGGIVETVTPDRLDGPRIDPTRLRVFVGSDGSATYENEI